MNYEFNRLGKYGSLTDLTKCKPSYVYELKFRLENKLYIGSRKSKSILVEDDFWVDYFTSSKLVEDLLLKYDSQDENYWEFRILEQFEHYDDAVKYEDSLLRSIQKDEKNNYLNMNFRAGGSIIRSNQHVKYVNSTTNKIELFPIDTECPVGYTKPKMNPPTRKGIKKWIDPVTFITGNDKIEDMPDGSMLFTEYIEAKRLQLKEDRKTKCQNRKKHYITNGKINKNVWSDLALPDGWWIGKTDFPPGMLGKTHSEETKLQMSKNCHFNGKSPVTWNTGLTKESNETLRRLSEKLKNNPKLKVKFYDSTGSRNYYNIETGEQKLTKDFLEFPWKLGTRQRAMMTPKGIICNEAELFELLGISLHDAAKLTREFPNEWYYLHPEAKRKLSEDTLRKRHRV